MKDFLLNENFSMMSIPSDHLIPLDTGVSTMSRTIKIYFYVENKIFELGYLNYNLNNKEVRDSKVHSYYLRIDTILSQFIKFLATHSAENAHNSKVNNLSQVTLKVTITATKTYYSLILTGDTTGVMTFQPSKFIDSKKEEATDLSSLEPLIESIINEKKPKIKHQVKNSANIELDIISICREIVNASNQTNEKIRQLRDLLNQ